MFHPEKLPSAQDRFIEQTKRVVGVLDAALAQSKSGWLVGDKCTYVDLSFFTWDEQIGPIMAAVPDSGWREDEFPNWKKWHERMGERKAVKKVVEDKAKMLAEAQH
ncbi:MAG: hypothetical protein Q9207_007850 [Kuettlingeria erythrocarpa]